MSDIIFLQDFDESVVTNKDKVFIPLTPMAMYELDKRNIKYKIPQDYYVWYETEKYKDWFYNWCNEFDDFLYYYYKDLGESITTHFIAPLKRLVETFVRKYLQFKEIIRQEKPNTISIVRADNKYTIDDDLYFKEGLFYLFLENGFFKNAYFTTISGNKKITTNWRDIKWLRIVYDWLRCFKFIPSYKRESVLFVSPVPDKMRVLKLLGYKVEVLKRYELGDIFNHTNHIKIIHRLFKIFEDIDISAIDAKAILYDRLNYFVNDTLNRTLWYYFDYRDYIIKNKFCTVFVTRRNDAFKYAAVIAAKNCGILYFALGCKTIYVRHGWQGYYNEEFYIKRWFEPFDYHLIYSDLDRKFYNRQIELAGVECQII